MLPLGEFDYINFEMRYWLLMLCALSFLGLVIKNRS